MKRAVLGIFFLTTCVLLLYTCQNVEDKASNYKNISDHSVTYVGMERCKSCHWQVYETFIKTGMGQSWGLANKEKSAANFSHHKAIVYDTINDLYYKPYWEKDSLYILEFRISRNDTIYKRIEKVSYIVGSGQHTNSHIIDINGYLYQAPITFYTQKGKWDLAPGFEKGHNTRFDRKIEAECITCHNGYPKMVAGSINKYTSIPLGIDCERCHGPGSLHVSEKRKGNIVDTSKEPDYTIVNPKRLNTEQQNNLCQRCHLQGIAVINDGKTFFDYLPSEGLSKTMNVFMPVYSADEQNMIMASHVERMKLSACYINSGKVSCITCHNPHVSVKYTPQEQYISACLSCHTTTQTCTENKETRIKKNNNCLECHMPKNTSIDIPHVAVTDHYIRKRPSIENKKEIAQFVRMQCYTTASPTAKIRAKAFLEFYERYQPIPIFLDSTKYYLKLSGVDIDNDASPDIIRVLYLQQNYKEIERRTRTYEAKQVTDEWHAYRIGDALLKTSNTKRAIPFLIRACSLKNYNLDFKNKLCQAYIDNKQYTEAKENLQFMLRENPHYALAHFNMGYIAMEENNLSLAKNYFQRSLLYNPDHVQSLINLAVVYYKLQEPENCKKPLEHALHLEPNNTQVKAMLSDLQ